MVRFELTVRFPARRFSKPLPSTTQPHLQRKRPYQSSTFLHFWQKLVYFSSQFWPYRLSVRTKAFQALKRGSTPRRVTKLKHRHGFGGVLIL